MIILGYDWFELNWERFHKSDIWLRQNWNRIIEAAYGLGWFIWILIIFTFFIICYILCCWIIKQVKRKKK